MVGRVCGNRASGQIELCDETGSIPLVVSIPYSPEPEPDQHPWLSGVREGSKVVITDFTVIAEKTEESEKTVKFYLHPHHMRPLSVDKSPVNVISGEGSTVGGSGSGALYVYISTKNCLKLGVGGSKSVFETLALVHSDPAKLESTTETAETDTVGNGVVGNGVTGVGVTVSGAGMTVTGAGVTGAGVTGAGVTGTGVTGAGVTGGGVTGGGVNGAGVTGAGATAAGVTGAGVTGGGVPGGGVPGAGMTGGGVPGGGVPGAGMTGGGVPGGGMTGGGVPGGGVTGGGVPGAGMTGGGVPGGGVPGGGMTGGGVPGGGVTGAGVTGGGVTGAGVTGGGVSGAGVTGAGVTGAGVSGAGVTGAGVTGAASVVLGFTSGRYYSYIHNGCTYRLSCPEGTLPALEEMKQSYITVDDAIRLELVGAPHNQSSIASAHTRGSVLEVGEVVSMFYLPKLQTAFDTGNNVCSRSAEIIYLTVLIAYTMYCVYIFCVVL